MAGICGREPGLGRGEVIVPPVIPVESSTRWMKYCLLKN
jgi:hypothetical protein